MTCWTAPEISSAEESAKEGVAAATAKDDPQTDQAAPRATAVWPPVLLLGLA